MVRNHCSYVILALVIVFLFGTDAEDCDNWDLKTDHKCYKLDESQTLDYESSKTLCNKLSSKSTLVTIESDEEQQLISEFMFKNRSIIENVWIGAKKTDNKTFVWDSDYRVMSYTNWDPSNQNKDNYDCVEMESEVSGKTGKWLSVPCKKRNVILCQIKFGSDQNNTELENRFNQLNREVKQFMTEMNKFRSSVNEFIWTSTADQIPKGFLYFQLPNQTEPKVLWPKYDWLDISGQYDSLFFRVLGKKTKEFGSTQESSSSVINNIEESQRNDCKTSLNSIATNQWSDWITSGGNNSSQSTTCLRFKSSSDEVRPMNTAIKVWRRTN